MCKRSCGQRVNPKKTEPFCGGHSKKKIFLLILICNIIHSANIMISEGKITGCGLHLFLGRYLGHVACVSHYVIEMDLCVNYSHHSGI